MENAVIKNTSSGCVHINLPNVRYRRDLNPGQSLRLPEEVYEDFKYDEGCEVLLKEGFLKLVSSPDDFVEELCPEQVKTSDDVNLSTLFKKTPMELAEVLKNASMALKQEIVEQAIKDSVADITRVNLIKKYTGVDVLSSMSLNRGE